MEGVYEELGEANAEIAKLREECKKKAEVSESLKRSHTEHLAKSQEANSRIEKQAREINEKTEEISVLKNTIDDLRGSLSEKDSTVKRLAAANEKLRVDCDLKVKKLEEETRVLVLTLEEVNGKSFEQEHRIRAFEEEISGLKRSLSVSQKKCSEAEAKVNRSKEAKEQDNAILDLEEGKRKIEEQLKWKKEQFTHLEEAHRKLRDQFTKSEKEWESEKSLFLDEICSLQTRLDSQIRISEDLQSRLGICNQALAHEESRRKSLEVQLCDVQSRFENVFSDYEEAKFQLQGVTEKRDEEIASLRHSLSKKEAVLKEMEYQKQQIEQENEEIHVSLKEFRESQIQTQKAPASASVVKLQNKVKSLEQMSRESSENLKAKEAEMNEKVEKLTRELNNCGSELENKEQTVNDLRAEMKELHENIAKLNAEVSEKNSELEKVKDSLVSYKSDLESRDVIIEELRLALEQIHSESTANFQALEIEWKSRVELIREDLKSCQYQLKKNNEVIAGLNEELGKLHVEHSENLEAKEAERISELGKVTADLNNLSSLLECRDAAVRELETELAQTHGDSDSISQFENREAELKLQEEKMKQELEKYKFKLEKKEEAMKKLKMELQQNHEKISANAAVIEAKGISEIESVRKEMINYKTKLENGEAIIQALRLELEEVHRDFALNLQSKEAEWNVQLESMKSLICDKEERLKGMKFQNEELSMTLLVLKNGIFEAQVKIDTEKLEMHRNVSEKEETKNAEIVRLQNDVVKESEKISSLLKRVESLETDDHEKHLQMQKELGSYEEMLMESSIAELFVREQLLQNQRVLREQLKIKEDEWKNQLEAMRVKLDDEEARVKKLESAMEDCNSSRLELKNEEISALLLVLKNVISEKEESVSELSQKLEMKNTKIDELQKEIGKDHEKASSLSKALENYEEMLMESSITELFVKEQWLQNDCVLREKLRLVSAELERANSELAEKIGEGNRLEFELYIWKSVAERFRVDLEEGFEVRKELEASLLAQVIVGETIEREEKRLSSIVEEKDSTIDDLRKRILLLEQETLRREFEELLLAKVEKERLILQIFEKQTEINVVRENWEKIAVENEEKNGALKTKLQNSEAVIEDLKSEGRSLVEDIARLSSEKESMLRFIGQFDDSISEILKSDNSLMNMLEDMIVISENPSSQTGLNVAEKENKESLVAAKKLEASSNNGARSPFREINELER